MSIKRTRCLGFSVPFSGSLLGCLAVSAAFWVMGCSSPVTAAKPDAPPAADTCKDPKDCLNKGALAIQAKDFAKAAKFLPSGCEVEPKACNIVGELYRKGDGVPADGAKAADFHKKACNAGISISCAIEAQLRYTGEGGAVVDKPRARALFEKTCGPEMLDHCALAGLMYSSGDGGPADKVKARTLYDTACSAGEMTGCVNGGAMYLNGEGGAADKVKARTYFEKACDQKNADGCFNLGLVYAKGIEVPVDYDKAIALLKKGCDAGSKQGCEVAQQIQDDLAKQKEAAAKPAAPVKGKGKGKK